eukprot:380840_1
MLTLKAVDNLLHCFENKSLANTTHIGFEDIGVEIIEQIIGEYFNDKELFSFCRICTQWNELINQKILLNVLRKYIGGLTINYKQKLLINHVKSKNIVKFGKYLEYKYSNDELNNVGMVHIFCKVKM